MFWSNVSNSLFWVKTPKLDKFLYSSQSSQSPLKYFGQHVQNSLFWVKTPKFPVNIFLVLLPLVKIPKLFFFVKIPEFPFKYFGQNVLDSLFGSKFLKSLKNSREHCSRARSFFHVWVQKGSKYDYVIYEWSLNGTNGMHCFLGISQNIKYRILFEL